MIQVKSVTRRTKRPANNPANYPSRIAARRRQQQRSYIINDPAMLGKFSVTSPKRLREAFIKAFGAARLAAESGGKKDLRSAIDTFALLQAGRFLVRKEGKFLAGDLMHGSGSMQSEILTMLEKKVKLLEEFTQAGRTYFVFELVGRFKTNLLAQAKRS